MRRTDRYGAPLDLLLHRAGALTVAVDERQATMGRAAWRAFGHERHPAGLDFGNGFSYALARVSGEPLLFKGDDFAQTDVRRA